MGDQTPEWREKIVRVPSQHLGVERLKSAVDAQETIFCVCEVGRDFQIGAGDAKLLLSGYCEAAAPEQIESPGTTSAPQLRRLDKFLAGCEIALYQPLNIAAPAVAAQISALQERHEWVCGILDRAYAEDGFARPHREGDHLHVPEEVKQKVVLAFELLIRNGFLPLGVGNSVFNHMTLVLLISKCFVDLPEEALVSYLRNPASFFPDEPREERTTRRLRFRRESSGNLRSSL